MTDVAVFFYHRILARKTVHYAIILNIGAIFHHDAAKITA